MLMLEAGQRGGGARLGGQCPPLIGAGYLAASSLKDKVARSVDPSASWCSGRRIREQSQGWRQRRLSVFASAFSSF
jgi:hypothetical protein